MDLTRALPLLPANLHQRVCEQVPPADSAVHGPCWVVSGRLNRNGYARLWWRGREPVAHRVTYHLLVGEIPPGMILDHLCRRPACCNPAHLEPVTVRINTLRGNAVLFSRMEAT